MVFYLSRGIIPVLDARKTRKGFHFICTDIYLFTYTQFSYKTNVVNICFKKWKAMLGGYQSETAAAYSQI